MLDENAIAEFDAAVYDMVGEPVTAGGATFAGVVGIADQGIFDAAQAGEIELRYSLADASLQRGDVVLVRGIAYRIAEPPRRIGDGREALATLVAVQDAAQP